MTGDQALSIARKYVQETLSGAGALKGEKGDPGQDGKDGFSPTIEAVEITGGYRVTVTDADGSQSFDIMNGADGTPGAGVSGVEKTGTEGLTDTYRMSFTDGTHFDYQVKNGEQGLQGIPGAQGEPGNDGQQGIQGVKGDKGDDGYPFLIYKEYASLDDFNAADFPKIGLMFMVKTEGADSFPVYRYTGEGDAPYSYITGLSQGEAIKGDKGDPGEDGAQGVPGKDGTDGKTYSPVIGEVNSVPADQSASASVTLDEYALTAKFNFNIPEGADGVDGFTPTIKENPSNKEDYYRLDIENKDKKFTTPNLMGVIGMEYKNKSVGTPVGEIIAFMGTIIPSNYLVCDGSVYNIADYPYLSQFFADNFGSVNHFGGDGTETFAVPDLRGEFIRGTGTNVHANQGNGAAVGTHQDATISHNVFGRYNDGYIQANVSYAGYGDVVNADFQHTRYGDVWTTSNKKEVSSGTNGNYTSRPTNTSVQFCIKYQPTYWITPTNEGPADDGVGGGVTDYNDLDNRPSINGVILAGNLTLEQLGIAGYVDEAIQNSEINVSADFLTTDGFGNLRYYNGKFQAYQNGAWVDVAPTPDNTIVVNMMPNPMQRIIGIYDHEVGKNKLKWLEPDDTVVDGQIICVVDKVVIRRKLGSAPQNENDGDIVIELQKKDFNSHNADWYFDEGVTPTLGDIYYYKAFPVSTTGFVNAASVNEVEIKAKDHYLYGFVIDQNESDPDSMVAYIEDNKAFSKASMDYNADRFNYGDWQDTFIMPKPCMLNTDGTVAYYLDPDDYTKKADGTDSDVVNVDFDGNAMNEWGKIFWKVTDNGDGTGTFLFSDKKVDNDFVYWSNMDENGNEIPHFYTPLYDGSLINGKLRSLSGQTPMSSKTRQQELDYAHANNPSGVHMYETDVFCDVQLFRMLCVLISKTTDSKKAFGSGNNNSYVSTSNTGVKNTGTMDKKGMFWGNQDNKTGVKVFGREHPLGNIWKSCAGWMNVLGTQKVKMTYGQSDGSAVDGYNITGGGYITVDDATPSGTSGGYISLCKFTENGIIPKQASGSSTIKYCDVLFFNNNHINYALFCGSSESGLLAGVFSSHINNPNSTTYFGIGASISCKPPASIQGGES